MPRRTKCVEFIGVPEKIIDDCGERFEDGRGGELSTDTESALGRRAAFPRLIYATCTRTSGIDTRLNERTS